MTKRKRWGLLLMGALAAFGLVFAAACGDDDDDDGDSGSSGGEQTGKPGGSVTIGGVQFENWDPHFSDFAQDIAHFMMVWRGLYHLDTKDIPQPAMADGKPTVSADGKTYTVKLKKDLKWSDGQPLTAQDFVLGIQRTCNPDNAGHYQYILTAIVGCDDYYGAAKKTPAEKDALLKAVGVRAVDATTVEYKLTDAQPTFPILLALWPTFPVPKHKVSAVDAKWPGPLENVYNGPFMPKAYTEKANMELVQNPNWAGGSKALLEKLTIKYIDDDAVGTNAFRSNELDATTASKAELDKLKTEFAKELQLYPATRTTGIHMQLKDPTLAKQEVRFALSQSIDRVTLNKVVFKDSNIPTTSWMPPVRNGLKGGEYDAAIGFNVAKAKENLAKAGFPDGKGFPQLSLVIRDDATNKLLGEFLQAEWKKNLNIEIKLDVVDSKTRSAKFNKKEFQLFVGGWQEDYPDPENWLLGQFETGGSLNKDDTSIPALDDVINKAKFNTNDEQRRQQYRDAEKILVEQLGGMAPMYHNAVAKLVRAHVKGMVENKRPGDTFVPGEYYPEFWSTTKK
ncbi:MAG: ABC transporter substrate-binding protein [Dehalococcoidia bacterium]